MRRSSIWFVIAALWLVDAGLGVARGHAKESMLPAVVALLFVVVGVGHRRREAAMQRRVR
jgi:hypothetical protein